jgi:hypothetical protein
MDRSSAAAAEVEVEVVVVVDDVVVATSELIHLLYQSLAFK